MPPRPIGPYRLGVVAGLAALHFGTYLAVTRIVDRLPSSALWNFSSPIDNLIPYLPWTWPMYWAAYPFVAIVGTASVLRLSPPDFRRAAQAFALMIVGCGILQVLLPAPAPWPENPGAIQRLAHSSALVRRWATLPSMHVALCTLTTYLGWRAFRGRATRAGAVVMTGAVALSTLTLKEHVFLDSVTGALAGMTAGSWWRRGFPAERAPGVEKARASKAAPPRAGGHVGAHK